MQLLSDLLYPVHYQLKHLNTVQMILSVLFHPCLLQNLFLLMEPPSNCQEYKFLQLSFYSVLMFLSCLSRLYLQLREFLQLEVFLQWHLFSTFLLLPLKELLQLLLQALQVLQQQLDLLLSLAYLSSFFPVKVLLQI